MDYFIHTITISKKYASKRGDNFDDCHYPSQQSIFHFEHFDVFEYDH